MAEYVNDLINILCNYIRTYLVEPARIHSRKGSLIRRIGSYLPLKAPPRMRIPLKIRESFVSSLMKKRLEFEDNLIEDRLSGETVTTLPKPDFLLDVYQRSQENLPKIQNWQGEEIISLKEKVQMLEDIINKILLTQKSSNLEVVAAPNLEMSSDSNPAQPNKLGTASLVPPSLPPPPPPPLPPPLPGLFPTQNRLIISKSKLNQLKENSMPSRPSMGEVLKDLHKIKLRHVERSPGGGPIKQQRAPNSPRGCLAAVLRKRFEAIQTRPDESLEDEYDSDDSMNSFQTSKTEAGH